MPWEASVLQYYHVQADVKRYLTLQPSPAPLGFHDSHH